MSYEEDIAIIEAATPGPWDFGFYNVCSKEEAMELAGLDYEATKLSVGVRPQGYGAFVNGTSIKVSNCGYSDGNSEDNARFIAHFNPTYVRELVEIKRLAHISISHDNAEMRTAAIWELAELLK